MARVHANDIYGLGFVDMRCRRLDWMHRMNTTRQNMLQLQLRTNGTLEEHLLYQLPLLVLPHLRPLGTSVGGKLLGTGASCIVTAVLRPCGGCICATTSLRVCDLAQVYLRILATSASEVAAMWIPAQWAGMVCWSLAAEQWHHHHQ